MRGNAAYKRALDEVTEEHDALAMARTLADQVSTREAFPRALLPALSDTIKAHVMGEKHADKKARRKGYAYAHKLTPRQFLQSWGLLAYADECKRKHARREAIKAAHKARAAQRDAASPPAPYHVPCTPEHYKHLPGKAHDLRAARRLAFARFIADKLDGHGRPSVAERAYEFEYHTSDALGSAPGPYFLLDYNGIVALAQAFGYKPASDYLEKTHTHNPLSHERKAPR